MQKFIVQIQNHIMKKLILILAISLGFMFSADAQIKTPAPSQFCKLEQNVGLTKVTVEYSRPNVKGRELFVEVEAFGEIWRTGANATTKITFDDDVKLEGKEVKAGTYGLYSIPGKEKFTIMLTNDLKLNGNVAKYDVAKEAVRFDVEVQQMPVNMETFTIDIGDIVDDGALISLMWGTYWIGIQMDLDTDDQVMSQIETALAGTSKGEYYSAGSYYFSKGKDMEKALEYVQKANSMGDAKFWQVYKEAEILAELGKYKEALEVSQKSLDLAKAADYKPYIKRNEDFMKKYIAKAKK